METVLLGAQLTPVCENQRVRGIIKWRRGWTVKRLLALACSVQESQLPHKDTAKWVASEQIKTTAGAISNHRRHLQVYPGSFKCCQMLSNKFEFFKRL